MTAEFDLTGDQREALAVLVRWIREPKTRRRSYATLGGLAGTGKTALVAEVCREFPQKRIRFCAYTAKAAAVLRSGLAARGLPVTDRFRSRSPVPSHGGGAYTVTTIHGLTKFPFEKFRCAASGEPLGNSDTGRRDRCVGASCRTRSTSCDVQTTMHWISRDSLPDTDLVVVDEASMITEDLWKSLRAYGVPIIAVGDHGQLPPIGGRFNLMNEGDLDAKLETIVRQAEGSAIVKLAQLVRSTGKIPRGYHETDPDNFVAKIDMHEFETRWADHVVWDDDVVVICGRNATRCTWNRLVRGMRGLGDSQLAVGERLVCLRNSDGMYNGMTGTVVKIHRMTEKFAEVAIRVDDSDVDSEPLQVSLVLAQLGREGTLSSDEMRAAEVSGKHLWDYGYVWTAHKAQGSSIDRVIVIEERLWKMGPDDWKRWLYTAVTRAKRKLIVIG